MDTGYAFLVAFFIFWTVQIIVGVIVHVANLGFHVGNFRQHAKELFQNFLRRLESTSHHRNST